jgi:hypothetical protein
MLLDVAAHPPKRSKKGGKREDIVYCLKNLGGKRGGRCQMTEGRWQRLKDRGRRTEHRGQKVEGGRSHFAFQGTRDRRGGSTLQATRDKRQDWIELHCKIVLDRKGYLHATWESLE